MARERAEKWSEILFLSRFVGIHNGNKMVLYYDSNVNKLLTVSDVGDLWILIAVGAIFSGVK